MLKICFEEDYLYSEGALDTIFYVSYNDLCFPDNQWTDFIVPVLHMWCSVIIKNYNISENIFSLPFMDGPFYINCIKKAEMIHMEFVDNRQKKTIVGACDVNIADFKEELIRVSIETTERVNKLGFGEIRDLIELQAAIENLKKYN